MKVSEEYMEGRSGVSYLLDCEDGQWCRSEMYPSVAEEIVRRAEKVHLGGIEGYEVVVNDRMMFPLGAFDWEGEPPQKENVNKKRSLARKRKEAEASLAGKAE